MHAEEKTKSTEFFYVVDGKRCDAAIHEQILAEGTGAGLEDTIKRALAGGMDPETVKRLYGNGDK